MSKEIVPQEEQEVKPSGEYILGDSPGECGYDGCREPAFRHGLCFEHFVAGETAKWDDQRAERATCLAGVGWR